MRDCRIPELRREEFKRGEDRLIASAAEGGDGVYGVANAVIHPVAKAGRGGGRDTVCSTLRRALAVVCRHHTDPNAAAGRALTIGGNVPRDPGAASGTAGAISGDEISNDAGQSGTVAVTIRDEVALYPGKSTFGDRTAGYRIAVDAIAPDGVHGAIADSGV